MFESGTRFSELTQLLLNFLVPPGPDLPVSGRPSKTTFFKGPVLTQLLLSPLAPPKLQICNPIGHPQNMPKSALTHDPTENFKNEPPVTTFHVCF